jgi:transposase
LHLDAGLTYAEVGRALGIPKYTVGKMMLMARAAGVDWALAQTLSDEELEARLYRPPAARLNRQVEPDYALIHQELKRPGVTLMLLWEEYRRGLLAADQLY